MQNTKRLYIARKNVLTVLQYGKVMPFNWNTSGFRCFYCGKFMRDCVALREHTESKHSSVDMENCLPKRIISKDVPVKIDVTDIACKFCPNTDLNTLEDLISHITSIHKEEYDDTAGVCIFPFCLKRDIMNCVLCESVFDNFTSLMRHMNKEHIAHGYICQICGLSFVDSIRLKRHITYSHVGHRCTLCGKLFEASHKLEWHRQRIHGQVKTHECNLCSETFDNKYQVKVHMGKVHNVEKYRIKCEYCPKICTTKGAMVLHVQSLHSEVRYECDICEYKTAIKWMIKLHRRKHFGEKNYACSICQRKFGRSSNLRAHMKVHTGQNGRVCRRCHQGFTDFESLSKHELELHYFEQV
ncbi:zinc finger protein 432-like [Galleria mellonella]|uniref:Zinc finger protein 432-like n=1 Tax=Galleria mellonella TaxID=7137 RepID=A0A6J1WFF9_GALME|nr:zinc finger protein 432-like [Galleria mellonella]